MLLNQTQGEVMKLAGPAKLADFVSSAIPLGRREEPEELAKAVLFLASDDSSYVNAVELMVDGGATGAPWGAPLLRA
jgi:NAD(P)-dependent dehydrogenase (short-subunit alcohol dehydrogenase family)